MKKADEAYSTGVVGIVDQMVYVPDATTKAAYQAQQDAWNKAQTQRSAANKAAQANGTKPDYSNITMPNLTIIRHQGNLHAIVAATSAPTGTYINVVTLGSYKGVKVDASLA